MQRTLRGLVLFCLTLLVSPVSAEEFFLQGRRPRRDDRRQHHRAAPLQQLSSRCGPSTRFPDWNLTFRNVGHRRRSAAPAATAASSATCFAQADGDDRRLRHERRRLSARSTNLASRPTWTACKAWPIRPRPAGIRVAWATPQPLDTADPGRPPCTAYNQTLEKYSEGVKEIAEKNGGLFVDQFHPYLAVLDKARAAEPEVRPHHRRRRGPSRPARPGPDGLLDSQGLHFPKQVSSVEIDAADSSKVEATNCRVTEVARDGDGVRFVRRGPVAAVLSRRRPSRFSSGRRCWKRPTTTA